MDLILAKGYLDQYLDMDTLFKIINHLPIQIKSSLLAQLRNIPASNSSISEKAIS